MLGATLDDGWGHGIRLILKFAEALGCTTQFLGVLCPIDTIVEACEKELPDILGLTVLQLDTETTLADLSKRLMRGSCQKPWWIAGGPVFTIDPELKQRVGIDFVAGNAAHFIRHMLNNTAGKLFT
jgi:methanogenic corrinoid protein MtbC1